VILTYQNHTPELGADAFVARTATVIGRVSLGEQASIWYGSVARGDVGEIIIGRGTNVQDLSMLHVTSETADTCRLGAGVTVGHRCILHGCTVGDNVLIGMGAIVLDGADIGPWSVVGAGSLVTPGKKIPEGSLVVGAPGRVIRAVTDEEREGIVRTAAHYVERAVEHAGVVEV